MKYELAKQLRDAGFPQSGNGKWIGPPEKIVWRSGDRAYAPTLEELIDGCGKGDDSFHLCTRDGVWIANFRLSDRHAGSHTYAAGQGPAPAEAVAKLWLALHTV
jgi:hypothetical protein